MIVYTHPTLPKIEGHILISLGRSTLFGCFAVLTLSLVSCARQMVSGKNAVDYLADSQILPLNGQLGAPVINCSYSLIRTTISVLSPPGREKITHIRTEYEERDAQGRTRNVSGVINGQVFQPSMIALTDPKAGTITVLSVDTKKGILTQYKASSSAAEPCGRWNDYLSQTAAGPNGLPSFFVDGVKGLGSRQTINGKSASGQTGPVRSDRWTAEDLNIPLRSETVDSATGQVLTTVVSSLSRNTPDPADFQIPPGYQVTTHTR